MEKAKTKITGLKAKSTKKVSGSPKKAITDLKMKSSMMTNLSGGKKMMKAKRK